MKWLITIVTAALITTGCMLESPDPCESSPIGCDVVPYTAPTPKPSQPSVTPTAGTESITISYATSGASYYFVHSSETLPVGVQNQIETTSSTHTFTGLDPNKEYHYTVTAVNDSGISSPSTTVKSQPRTVATSPTVSPTTDTSNTVTWTAVNGADDYIVYMSTATPVTTADTAVNAGTGTSYVHSGLNAGDTWYYMVTPRNEVGAVDSIEVFTEVLPQTPGTLTAAPKPEGGAVTLSWTASAGHDGYNILYAAGSQTLAYLQANGATKPITNTTKVTQNISSLNINQLGSYVIVAYNSAGNSVYSNVVEEQAVPRSPQLQTPNVSQPGKVVLTWLDNNGVNSFKVYRMTGSSGNPETDGTLIATLSGSVKTYTDTSFPTYGGTTYRYAVVPEGGGGVGNIGTQQNAVPLEPAWESVMYDGSDAWQHIEVAGTATGEAYVLGATNYANKLFKYNNVSELQYEVTLTDYPVALWHNRALELSIAPDGNLMILARIASAALPNGLTTSTSWTYLLAKIDSSNGSYIWAKAVNPFDETQWTTSASMQSNNFSNNAMLGFLAEMVVDSTGNTYVAWGTTGVSGWVKYDTNGTLTASYDRIADTTGESLGKYAGKPVVVVLPDDSFFWFQLANKNFTNYLMGSKWASDGSVIFKNRTLYNTPTYTNVHTANQMDSSHARHTGVAVADAVGNMFVALRGHQGAIWKFNSEGTFISGTDEHFEDYSYGKGEVVLGTNGESVYAVSTDGNMNEEAKFIKYSNTLASENHVYQIGKGFRQDIYVDPTNCFVYVAGRTHETARGYGLGNPSSSSFVTYSAFSNYFIQTNKGNDFLLYRVNNDLKLNAGSSSCPTPSALPSVNTPVSIAGNGSELGYYVHSGKDGFGDWRMKHSSASTPIEHTETHVDKIFYSTNHDCILIGDTLKCKGAVPEGLGDSAGTTSSSTYVEIDSTKLGSVTAVSVGSNFTCAVGAEHGNLNGNTYCWGEGNRGRLGVGGTDSFATPQEVLGGVYLKTLTSGKNHTCGIGTDDVTYCWGDNAAGQTSDAIWNGTSGTRSRKQPQPIVDLVGTASLVKSGMDALYTCAITGTGNVECWGTDFTGVHTDPYTVSGISTAVDIAVAENHTCAALSDGTVQCWGSNASGQLGDGTTTNSGVPVTVSGITTASVVYTYDDYTCAGLTDGTYTCWGSKAGW